MSKVPPSNSLAAPATGPVRARSSALVQYVGGDDDLPAIGSDFRFARSLARASWLSSQLMTSSSVARRAARARVNVVVRRLLLARGHRIAGRLPLHVRHFV